MPNPFANRKPAAKVEQAEDRLGGFSVHETDAYPATIKNAFLSKSAGGAEAINFEFDLGGGKLFSPQVWFTNKAGEFTFQQKDRSKNPVKNDDGTPKLSYLPGYTILNDVCLVASGMSFTDEDFSIEEKMVSVYDSDQKKKVPKSMMVLTDLLGKKVGLLINKVMENKSVKSGNDYVPTAETRDVNEIAKVFDLESQRTVLEATNAQKAEKAGDNVQPPMYVAAWLEKNKGKTQDKRTIKDGSAGTAGRPTAAGGPPQAGDSKPRSSLFKKD
jgi:hypothetical protein